MGKILTVAVIGCGSRGCLTYSKEILDHPDKFKLVSFCDLNEDLLNRQCKTYGVPRENSFTDENEFFKEKRADICIVATQDRDHFRHAVKAMKIGYDILLEKPVTDSKEECYELLRIQKETGAKVMVCHVLRYSPLFYKAKQIIDSGEIGQLIEIQHLENVASWHQAHSYVRGNWRNTKNTHAMILAKCCHDLDLLCWYSNSKCKSLSSVGDLAYLNKAHQPKDASNRCLSCKYQDTCGWSAKTIYYTSWVNKGRPDGVWPQNVIVNYKDLSDELILDALKKGPYGRCIFDCDNDVVDHQDVMMTFENGVKATLTMTGFTRNGGRLIRFHGSDGELVLDTESMTLTVGIYERPIYVITGDDLVESSVNSKGAHGGHYGADTEIIKELYEYVANNKPSRTSFEISIESHLMGIACEESRHKDGERIVIEHQN